MDNKEKFARYADLLREWSEKMNLVAPSTLTDIELRHFADSSQLADVLPRGVQIIDLGSGAGFPGVILAMYGWDVTCVESIGKKASFLNTLKTELDLPNLTVFHGRVEDCLRNFKPDSRGVVFTARAFASLSKIFDYTAHVKSRLFLLKGREIETEILDAKKKYKFDYELTPSRTGDGFIIRVENLRPFHMK